MMVYLLYHKRLLEDDVYERKIIGIYSSYEMAASRIIKYTSICGFKDYPKDFFIDAFEVEGLAKSCARCSKKYVYFLQHEFSIGLIDTVTPIGVYVTKITAIVGAIKTMKELFLKFRKIDIWLGRGFSIDLYMLDEDNWVEGFVVEE